MTREADLLLDAAEALDDGRDPLTRPFLSDHEVSLDECYQLGENLAIGALIVAWAIREPKQARSALLGALDAMRLERIVELLKAGEEA